MDLTSKRVILIYGIVNSLKRGVPQNFISKHTQAIYLLHFNSDHCYHVKIQCSWGSKPTPPGTASNPLPPPAAASLPGLSATDLLAYERQLAISKMGGVHALMHPQGQHHLKQAAAIGASQAIYDGGFQNVAAAQQMMYYQ